MIRVRAAVVLLGIGGLGACATPVADEVAQSAAKSAVRPVLAERFPGVPLEPSVDCVIESATAGEILQLAADSVTGPDVGTAELVLTIAARPETVRCLATEGLSAFISG